MYNSSAVGVDHLASGTFTGSETLFIYLDVPQLNLHSRRLVQEASISSRVQARSHLAFHLLKQLTVCFVTKRENVYLLQNES